MTPLHAKYQRPATLEEALSSLAEPGHETAILSGGTHVMSHLNHDWPRVSRLLDLSAIPTLASVTYLTGQAVLGTAVTYATVLDAGGTRLPRLLRQISAGITGGPQIRNQGTIGGSACYANPASDMPAGLVALGATMTCVSASRGQRTMSAVDFFKSAFVTALYADEILLSITLPSDRPLERWGYVKLKTTESSWPVAVAAAKIADGEVTITIGAATEVPVTIGSISLKTPSLIGVDDVMSIRQKVRATSARWWADELCDATYRKRMAEVVAVRAAQDAIAKADLRE